MNENTNIICSEIMENLMGESRAMDDYFLLLNTLTNEVDRGMIREIIADEMNHSLILSAMAKRYSGIAASPDGALEALEILAEGLEAQQE